MGKLWAALGSILAVILGAVGLHRSGKKQGRLEVENAGNKEGLERAKKITNIKDSVIRGESAFKRLRDNWKR